MPAQTTFALAGQILALARCTPSGTTHDNRPCVTARHRGETSKYHDTCNVRTVSISLLRFGLQTGRNSGMSLSAEKVQLKILRAALSGATAARGSTPLIALMRGYL